ncbi:hypothetical protein BFS35_000025 [Macrococcoides goetzii]|uniref:Uncharacterized protein n=1 Tax=Macrococcoides goetzii TaxID=1891097 RepID=A0A2G5NQT1_9STAP|nr:hypothetical protein [Macrococcus goetzii]RAI82107.1 hypothetical protein BFS35_000025 [Macrococcus goetzii]
MNKKILIFFFKTFNLLIKSLVAAIAVYLVGSIFFDYQVIDIIDKYFIIIFLVAAIISSILEVEIENMEDEILYKSAKRYRWRRYY